MGLDRKDRAHCGAPLHIPWIHPITRAVNTLAPGTITLAIGATSIADLESLWYTERRLMSPLIAQVSKALHVPPKQLIRQGVLSYVEREIRLAGEDISDLREKYLANSPKDLTRRIKSKTVASHPAWEDVIVWENLEAHLRTLRKTLQKLG